MIAVGIGCGSGVSEADIIAVVALLVRDLVGRIILVTVDTKRQEAGLAEAAGRLGLTLHFVTSDALKAEAGRIVTRSPRSLATHGVGSVAEAAALAGAGPGSSLIGTRVLGRRVTAAVARSQQRTRVVSILPQSPASIFEP